MNVSPVQQDVLNIQVRRIEGDLVELFFNPREVDLRVGETLTLSERDTGWSVIVQVISFRSASYPSLVLDQLHTLVGPEPLRAPLLEAIGQEFIIPAELNRQGAEMGNIKVALAKIRKTVPGSSAGTRARWEQWDGWIPARDVYVYHTDDREVFANSTRDLGHRLRLGWTLAGHEFFIEGQDLEKVNVITGVKGSGKSHLSKVVLLQLIEQGAPCVVFDINREYVHLPKAEIDPVTGKTTRRGIVHLEAGGNFRLSVRQFGLAPMMTLLTRFGLPEVSALHFENRLSRLWAEAEELDKSGGHAPYIGLEQLIQMAEENEFGGGSSATVVNHAIRSRLEAVKNTRIFSRSPKEAASLGESYRKIREGGALVVDVSALSNLAREGFVQAIIELLKDLCVWEIDHQTHRFPFVFFEEAHLYVSRQSIDYIVTRARHLGITSFFVTNMIHGLDEAVLRQADNLFLLRIPFEDDVRHVSRGAATDFETMEAFVRRLRQRHALVVGNVTAQYPLIFRVDPLEGVNTAGETRYFFRVEE
ncbi:MAG: ATP-binding protein [Chloroflexi bacterium]|nr:ATP-binding protein [Chloroflexota bacterium]